jgi:hypothetical protein
MIFETAATISGESGRERREHLAGGLLAEQPIAKIPDGQVRYRCKCIRIALIHDQPRDFIRFVRHNLLIEKTPQRNLAQRHLRGHALFGICGGDPS